VNAPRHEHEPVLVEHVLAQLDPSPGQVILDGTVGLGGHAAALLPRIMPGGRYIGLDLDGALLAVAGERLGPQFGDALVLREANFAEFPAVLEAVGLEQVDHMLVDLGVNSAQLDDPTRGFSFDQDGPLDMRFSLRQEQQAIDLVNSLSEKELADVFYNYAQEGGSRKIAKRICQVRHAQRITTTLALARAVQSAMTTGRGLRPTKIHPATRVFQALRIAVNDELGNLERFLERVPGHLRPDGRLAVISFHSGEDGIVKRHLRAAKAAGELEELTKRPVIADSAERRRNPRSRSAKMRVARRVTSQS
jgi:16S rRNA (cytosine1402-N4)-methyltransferase